MKTNTNIIIILWLLFFTTINAQKETDVCTFNANGVEFNMIRVKGGKYMMGITKEQMSVALNSYYRAEQPVHKVKVNDFMIGETVVTQKLWVAVMGDQYAKIFENSTLPAGNDYPACAKMTWDSIQVFIKRLNNLTGHQFRLPTEAEWEYAARGGKKSKGYIYAGSNNIDEVAWYMGNYNGQIHEVALKKPNELGLYDMCGNVGELCNDIYDENYYSHSPVDNPKGPERNQYTKEEDGPKHSIRGFNNNESATRISNRIAGIREHGWHMTVSIRLALDYKK